MKRLLIFPTLLIALALFASACSGSTSDGAQSEPGVSDAPVAATAVPATDVAESSGDDAEVLEGEEIETVEPGFPEAGGSMDETLDALEAEGIDREVGERIIEALDLEGPVEPFMATMAAGLVLGMIEGFGFEDPNAAVNCIFDQIGPGVSLDALGGGAGIKAFAACNPGPGMFVAGGSAVPAEDAECAGAAFWDLINGSTIEEVDQLMESEDFPPSAAEAIGDACGLSDEEVSQLVDG